MKDHAFYHQAIYNTHPKVVTIDDTAGASDKDGNLVVIDEVKVAVEIAKLEAVWAANDNQRQRAVTYWPLADQLDALYWDKKNGTNVWEQHIEAVKAKYPKS